MTILSTLIAIPYLKALELKLCIQLKLIATKCVTMDNHQLTIRGKIVMAVDTGTMGGTRGCDYYSSGYFYNIAVNALGKCKHVNDRF